MSDAVCEVTRAFEEYTEFTEEKLCGRCIPCMTAAPMIIDTLERLRRGEATTDDISQLESICSQVMIVALCKHGQKAVANLSQSVKNHREVFQSHAEKHHCPEGSCEGLLIYQVNPERCTQCDKCREVCPEGAIFGEPYIAYRTDNLPYIIVGEKCSHCGECAKVCADGAIEVV
ncbi:MAG: NADH-ubiquinone oxidoreductase-F iron-sulfur binding region domain-containing protein [Bacillota bacterium]